MDIRQFLNTRGKSLISGDIGRALQLKNLGESATPEIYDSNALMPLPISPSSYNGEYSSFFQMLNGKNGTHYNYTSLKSCVNAYEECAPVAAILNSLASSYTNGKTWVLNTQGKEATTSDAKKLRALFKRPNPVQSWKQFEAQMYIYRKLFGYSVMLALKPVGFKDNIDATSLWNIPPSMLDIAEVDGVPFYNKQYTKNFQYIKLNYGGQVSNINMDDVLIIKDFVPSFNTLVLPGSRIRALELQINNIIGCYKSRNVLINYRGALGILTQEGGGALGPVVMQDEEKQALQSEFKRYGIQQQQWQFIITSASLKWQQMGVATKDLMLFEEIEDDIARLCDGIGYPDYLISSRTKSTFDNVQQGVKRLYQDFVIPDGDSIYEQFNQFFDTEPRNLDLQKDFSKLPVFQENKLEAANARKANNEARQIEWENNLITMNDWLRSNDDDPIPNGDVYYNDVIQDKTKPLATTLGVGGTQALTDLLANGSISPESKRGALVILFGLSPEQATILAPDIEQPETPETPETVTPPASDSSQENENENEPGTD